MLNGLRHLRFLIACSTVAALGCGGSVLAEPAWAHEASIGAHLNALTTTLGQRERGALQQIPEPERRLLAARAYLRAGSNIESRWSWSQAQIETYLRSIEYRQLLADFESVRTTFERRNPGYTLFANTQVRSLDTQIERWNSNHGVGRTAANLYADVAATFAARASSTDADRVTDLRRFLTSWRPRPAAPLAAPGLSMHGQMRAIDFQVMTNQRGKTRIVAGTNIGAVRSQWEAPGWDRRLQEAVRASGAAFVGPLESPNEPWHYEYKPRDGQKK